MRARARTVTHGRTCTCMYAQGFFKEWGRRQSMPREEQAKTEAGLVEGKGKEIRREGGGGGEADRQRECAPYGQGRRDAGDM